MPVVTGTYPGVVYGTSQEAVELDTEGLRTVRGIAENMLWLLRCIEAGRSVGINPR